MRRTLICAAVLLITAMRAAAADPSPWGSGRWVQRGPNNLSGLINAFLLDPDDRSVYLAGTRTGLWISRDEGKTWSAAESMFGTNIEGLTRDPTNHNTIYSASGIDGVFKSTDRGATWTRLSTSVRPFSIAVSADGKRVLAATAIAMQLSTDGGTTWTRVAFGGVIQGRVRFHPTDAMRAIAIFPILDAESEDSGFRTVDYSNDGGVTWQAATGLDADATGMTVEYVRDMPSTVIAYTTKSPAVDGKMWRSDDGGATFRLLGTARTFGGGMRIVAVMAAPKNPDLILAGSQVPLRTRDGGKTTDYAVRFIDGIDIPHADVHGMVPETDKRAFLWGDGGIYRTEDITADTIQWTYLAGGLANAQIYDFDVSQTGKVVIGMQDTGYALMDLTANATQRLDGDVSQARFDKTDDRQFFTAFFGDNSSGGGSVHKIVGTTRSNDVYIDARDGRRTAAGFDAFEIDPNDASRMYIGSSTILRAEGIQANPKPVRTTVIRRFTEPASMTTIAVKPGDSNTVWASWLEDTSNFNGETVIDRTTHALSESPQWENVTRIPASLGHLWEMHFDVNNPDIVYVLCNNGLTVTRDAGKTWADATASAPQSWLSRGLFTFERHPGRPDWWYVGGVGGLYVTTDAGATWQPAPLFANLYTRKLHFVPGTQTLWASFWSQGLWSIDIPVAARRRTIRH